MMRILAALLVLCLGIMPATGLSEERNLYIGDIIRLEIQSSGISESSLREAFEGFELLELTEKAGIYTLSLRTFTPGETIIPLGGQEIHINVASILEEIERDAPFDGEGLLPAVQTSFPLLPILWGAGGLFALSGLWLVLKRLLSRQRREKPYALFLKRVKVLTPESDGFFVALTRHFKEYLEKVRGERIIGKTSTEILAALSLTESFAPLLPDAADWFTACDRMKFSGQAATIGEKAAHMDSLLSLVGRMEAIRKEGGKTE